MEGIARKWTANENGTVSIAVSLDDGQSIVIAGSRRQKAEARS
jgi:hypothetical protein